MAVGRARVHQSLNFIIGMYDKKRNRVQILLRGGNLKNVAEKNTA